MKKEEKEFGSSSLIILNILDSDSGIRKKYEKIMCKTDNPFIITIKGVKKECRESILNDNMQFLSLFKENNLILVKALTTLLMEESVRGGLERYNDYEFIFKKNISDMPSIREMATLVKRSREVVISIEEYNAQQVLCDINTANRVKGVLELIIYLKSIGRDYIGEWKKKQANRHLESLIDKQINF